MRLLNVRSKKLELFADNAVPSYAILSHTWGKGEITFDHFQKNPDLVPRSDKINGCCTQMTLLGNFYVWIDTLCIDKSSSSELSEAINSMFKWYQNATICCVYLEDVPKTDDVDARVQAIRASRWFTRGWTLQELLAPKTVNFYDASWQLIGRKSQQRGLEENGIDSLTELISDITKIPQSCLSDDEYLRASVAQKMSWAANRQTTRIEDRAYSLLGLFQVNMSMLYGEGWNAFGRLQEEIIKTSEDHSIFTWGYGDLPSAGIDDVSCLARTIADFSNCGTIGPLLEDSNSTHYAMTNRGLHIELDLVRLPRANNVFLARLYCNDTAQNSNDDSVVALRLLQLPGGGDSFYRHEGCPPQLLPRAMFHGGQRRRIYILRSWRLRPDAMFINRGIGVEFDKFSEAPQVVEVYPPTFYHIFNRRASSNIHSPRSLPPDKVLEGHQWIHARVCRQDKYDFLIRLSYNFSAACEIGNKPHWKYRVNWSKATCQLAAMPAGLDSITELMLYDATADSSSRAVWVEKLQQESCMISAEWIARFPGEPFAYLELRVRYEGPPLVVVVGPRDEPALREKTNGI